MGSARRYRESHLKNNVDDGCRATRQSFLPQDTETPANWVDGTCMLISRKTLKTGGFLDLAFRALGWGSDAGYCYRIQDRDWAFRSVTGPCCGTTAILGAYRPQGPTETAVNGSLRASNRPKRT
jgi:GT2 family glycosyltransferase